jgi:hypothetical protein
VKGNRFGVTEGTMNTPPRVRRLTYGDMARLSSPSPASREGQALPMRRGGAEFLSPLQPLHARVMHPGHNGCDFDSPD